MKFLCKKVIVALTCIAALQFSSMVRTIENEPQKPKSSLLSRLKQKAKDKAASIKSAVKPSIA